MAHDGRVAVYFECMTPSSKPVGTMFDLARDIDVHIESQSTADEAAVAGTTAGLIGPDQEVTWNARHLGIRFRLTSRVTEFDPPHRFVDEQIRGPFAEFHHEHIFTPAGEGSVMVDRVRFTAPFGPLGRLAEVLVLSRYLRRLIQERGRHLAER